MLDLLTTWFFWFAVLWAIPTTYALFHAFGVKQHIEPPTAIVMCLSCGLIAELEGGAELDSLSCPQCNGN